MGNQHDVLEPQVLDDGVLVAHDASGPPAIDWALWHPERTAALVLLNTYYGRTLAARTPEASKRLSMVFMAVSEAKPNPGT